MIINNAEISIDVKSIAPGIRRTVLADEAGNRISIATRDIFRVLACLERDAESRGMTITELRDLVARGV